MSSFQSEMGWSERTNLQVQKMEATIEQDLSKAMAGIREQFRQQFDVVDRNTGTHESEVSMEGALEYASMAENGTPNLSAQTGFRSGPLAAPDDEVLGGLAQLRLDLEAERARQSSPSKGGIVDQEWHRVQAGPSDSALTGIRQDLLLQQSGLADLRRDMALHHENYQVRLAAFDKIVTQMHQDLKDACLSKQQGGEDFSVFRQSLHQDLEVLMRRCDHVEQFSQNIAEAAAAKLEQLEVRVTSTEGQGDEQSPQEHSKELLAEQDRIEEKMRERMEQTRIDLEQSVNTLREHVFAEIDMFRARLETRDYNAVATNIPPRGVESVADVDRTAQMVEEIRQDIQQALESLRMELQASIEAQSSSTTTSLRGHFSVACAEVRGELMARLDGYEASLHETNSQMYDRALPFREESEMMCNRLEAVEMDLQEVIQLAKLLATRFEDFKTDAAQFSRTVDQTANEQVNSDGISLIAGDLKESLEKLVEQVGIKLRAGEGDRSIADSDKDSLPPGPLLSHASDVPSHSGISVGSFKMPMVPKLQSSARSTCYSMRLPSTSGAGNQALFREQLANALSRTIETAPSPSCGNEKPSVQSSVACKPTITSPRHRDGAQSLLQGADSLQPLAPTSSTAALTGGRVLSGAYPPMQIWHPGYMPSRGQQGPMAQQETMVSQQHSAISQSQRTSSPVPTSRMVSTQRTMSPISVYRQGSIRRVASPMRGT